MKGKKRSDEYRVGKATGFVIGSIYASTIFLIFILLLSPW